MSKRCKLFASFICLLLALVCFTGCSQLTETPEQIAKKAAEEANAGAIAAEKERAEGIEAGLRTDVDAIKGDYLKASDKEALQAQINTIMNNPDAEGAITS